MKTPALLVRLVLLVPAMLAAHACKHQPPEPVVRDQLQQIEATIEAIDPATRMIVVRGPHGPASIVASSDVRNFDNMHVGDKVVVSYYEGLAAQIKKGSGKNAPAEATSTYTAPAGARPGAGVGRAVTAGVTIESVDTSFDTVTFRRPDGLVRTVAIQSPEGRKFIRTLKPGDEVEITYTEAVAVEVVPGK
jgi:hypothetical protein